MSRDLSSSVGASALESAASSFHQQVSAGAAVAARAVESLPRPVTAAVLVVVLAGLDLLGALIAKRATGSGGAAYLVLGSLTFVVLFLVYARSLRYAELVPVTFGWIAVLQVGLLVMTAVENGSVPPGHWAAAAAMIGLEGYLLASSSG